MDANKVSLKVGSFFFEIETIDNQNAHINAYFLENSLFILAGSAELKNNVLDITLNEPFLSQADTNNLYYHFSRATRTQFPRFRAGTLLREHNQRREDEQHAAYKAELDAAPSLWAAAMKEMNNHMREDKSEQVPDPKKRKFDTIIS